MGTTARIIAVATFVAAAIAGTGTSTQATAATQGGGQPLVSRLTGQCLTAAGGGTVLQQQACQGTANQQWRLQVVNGTLYFWVTDGQSGQCLDVAAPDNRVVQNSCDGRLSQRWTLWPEGGENYRLVNFAATGGGADLTAAGTAVQLGQWVGGVAQLWTVTRTPAPQTKATFRTEDRGTYWIGDYAIVNPDSAAVRDWVLEFDLPAGAWMGLYWNGVATVTGTHVTVRPSASNATVPPGGSTTPADFGFAALGVPRTPTACKLNGQPCAGPIAALRPPNVSAVTATQVSLFWLPPIEPAARYELSRNGVVIASVPGTATSYLDTGLASGSSYLYRLRMWTQDGRVSTFSPEIAVTTTS